MRLRRSILSFPPALGWREIVFVLIAASALRLIIIVKIPGRFVRVGAVPLETV